MKAVALVRHLSITDPESLVDVTLPDPAPTGHERQSVSARAVCR